jgi:two-component system cell cycle response regulator
VFIDIDHFKQINDTLGHAAGDQVLKETARRIDALRRNEDLLCRFGGEEFVLLLPYTTLEQAAMFADRVREAIASKPIEHYGKNISVTFSAGVASFPSGDTLEALLRRADQAMYRAKEKGRNRVEKEA